MAPRSKNIIHRKKTALRSVAAPRHSKAPATAKLTSLQHRAAAQKLPQRFNFSVFDDTGIEPGAPAPDGSLTASNPTAEPTPGGMDDIDDPEQSELTDNEQPAGHRFRDKEAIMETVLAMDEDIGRRKRNPELKAWHVAARLIGRKVHMFMRSSVAFAVGLDVNVENRHPPPAQDSEQLIAAEGPHTMSPQEQKELKYQCDSIIKMMPHLAGDLDFLLLDPTSLKAYGSYIDSRVIAARGDDIASVRERIFWYIPNVPGYKNARFDPLETRKTDCGWFNHTTARLLCPQDQLAEFDANPESFCTAVRNGERVITADDLPSFLYNNTLANADDPLDGLMHSVLLEMMYKSLWLGPSSVTSARAGATSDRSAGRPPLIVSYDITQVEPRTIAYVAVLIRFALNSQTQWSRKDMDFDCADFYNNLLGAFESPSWSELTLKWWNNAVFGNNKPRGRTGNVPRPNSLAARIAAQVAAEKTAAIEE